ncbi:MAG TPA: hypothetical protein VKU89_06885 [Solirubrobacteraceae bacterium]|nr:hypothetical protein [Solirubrobacteraceae bacterium]
MKFLHMRLRVKISKGGQVSIPAPIRHRWATSTLTLEDCGERLILTPAADDPIAAAEGALRQELPALDLDSLRKAAREDDQAAERRRGR